MTMRQNILCCLLVLTSIGILVHAVEPARMNQRTLTDEDLRLIVEAIKPVPKHGRIKAWPVRLGSDYSEIKYQVME